MKSQSMIRYEVHPFSTVSAGSKKCIIPLATRVECTTMMVERTFETKSHNRSPPMELSKLRGLITVYQIITNKQCFISRILQDFATRRCIYTNEYQRHPKTVLRVGSAY